MVPPTKTISEEDREAMFMRRSIDITLGSRYCTHHVIDGRLSQEAFYNLTPYKIASRLVSQQNLHHILQMYRKKFSSRKHIDFDDCFSLSDAEYKILTGFNRSQHDQILSYIQ